MAYQNVGTPRFYVDHLNFLKSLGQLKSSGHGAIRPHNYNDLIGLNPSNQTYHMINQFEGTGNTAGTRSYVRYYGVAPDIYDSSGNLTNYVAILGHNINYAASIIQFGYPYYNDQHTFNPAGEDTYGSEIIAYYTSHDDYINAELFDLEVGGAGHSPGYDGFSIATNIENLNNYSSFQGEFSAHGDQLFKPLIDIFFQGSQSPGGIGVFNDLYISCISHGNYFDMPHGPELNLTMSREMDGIKRLRTAGGSDLVDYKYTRQPDWHYSSPWELYNKTDDADWTNYLNNQTIARYGRRNWDLHFNYLSDRDLRPITESTDPNSNITYFGDGEVSDWPLGGYCISSDGRTAPPTLNEVGCVNSGGTWHSVEKNLLTSNDFFSQVIHKTNGGRLPFIFQPDKNNKTVFAICKFDMDTFSFEQVANGIYNVKLKIREVW